MNFKNNKKFKVLLETGLVALLTGFLINSVSHKKILEKETRQRVLSPLGSSFSKKIDYTYPESLQGYLFKYAGIKAGTMNIIGTKEGYLVEGSYNFVKDPKAMHSILKEIDVNEDHNLSIEEIKNYEEKFIKKYTQKSPEEYFAIREYLISSKLIEDAVEITSKFKEKDLIDVSGKDVYDLFEKIDKDKNRIISVRELNAFVNLMHY